MENDDSLDIIKHPRKKRTSDDDDDVTYDKIYPNHHDDDFLSHLVNDDVEEPITQIIYGNDDAAPPKKVRKTRVCKPKLIPVIDDEVIEPIFGNENSTPIYGKEKLLLMQKIRSYKTLFPIELKGFKINSKNPTEKQLQDALSEIQIIVEMQNVDSFITESILESLKLGENFSANTNFDLRGLSDALKQNKQFHSLLKILYLKYNSYSQIPPEIQLTMIVATSALVVIQKNKVDKYLEGTINI